MWHNESGYNGKLTNKRCEFDLSVPERIGRTMLILFGHVERVGKERLVKRVYRANVEGNGGRGRPQR